MKLLFIPLICAFTVLTPNAKASSIHSEGAPIDIISAYSESFSTPNIEAPVFRLFPTVSDGPLIKLNTRNGQIWQVNIALKKGKSSEDILNASPLVSEEEEENGRFILYPAQDSIFILLDQIDGRMWQVQWSTVFRDSYIIPIE